MKEWQAHPLQQLCAVVYMGAIHFHVRSEGQIVKKAVYIVIGLYMEGRRDVLGMSDALGFSVCSALSKELRSRFRGCTC